MKKIFLMIMLSAGSLFAGQDYFFNVNNTDELDFFATVFNAIPMILGDDEYMTLLRLAFLMGGFLTLVQMVLGAAKDAQGGLINFTKFQILGVAILTLIFADKSTVILKANEPTSYYRTSPDTVAIAIDNVPTTLAFAFKFFHTTGTELTKKFEMAFSNVSNPDGSLGGTYSMLSNGYASSLSHNLQLLNYDFQKNHTLGTQLDDFFSGCVYIPYSAKGVDGQEHIEQINKSEDILGLMGSWINSGETIGGIAAGDYTAETGGELMTCKDLYGLITTTTLPEFLAQAPNDPVLSKINDEDLGMLKSSRAVPVSDFEQMATQAGIINTMANAKNLSTGIPYAQGRERANFNMTNISQASFMSQQLPIMQNLFRGILYGIFPFMLVVLMMPGGLKVISEYGKTLLWVESWGIMAAIISYNIQRYTEKSLAVSGTNGLTLNNSVDLLSTTASMAGMSGYLYLSIPPLTWLLLKGSGQMLGSLTGGISASFAKHLGTAQNAKDAQMMKTKDEVSKQVGHDVSYAEAMNYKAIQAGITEGSSIGTNYNKGEGSQRDLNNYSNLNPYNQLKAKQDALGGGNDKVLAFEKAFGERTTSKNNAYVNNTTNQDASAGGTSNALDDKNKNYQLGTYGFENLNNLNNFKADETNIGGLQRMSLYDNSPAGRVGTIAGMEDIKAGTEIGTFNKNMDYTGGSTSKIADIMSSANNFDLARKDGNVATTTAGANYNAGVKEGAGTNATSDIVDKFGAEKLEKSDFHNQNKTTLQSLNEDDFYNRQSIPQDEYIKTLQNKGLISEKTDLMSIDSNGDGKVSGKELKNFENTMQKQQQADFITLQHEQKEKEQAALRMQNANDPRLRAGANSGDDFGKNSGSTLAGFNNAMVNADTTLKPYQNDIDLTTKRNLDNEKVGVKDIAEIKTVDTIEKDSFTKNRGENEAQAFLQEKDRAYQETYQKNLDKAHENGLSGTAAVNWASKQTASDVKMNDSQNGKRMFSSEVSMQKEQIHKQKEAIIGGDKNVEAYAQKQQALNAYKQQASKYAPGSAQRKMLDSQAQKLESDMKDIKSHAGNGAAFTQKVNALHKLNKQERDVEHNVASRMQQEGHLSIDKNGGIHFKDAKDDLSTDNPNLGRKTAAIKGDQDAHKVETVGLDGKEVTKTTDASGETITDSRHSKKANVEEGDFRTDVTYNLKDKTDVSDETLQYATTGLNVVKNVTEIAPVGKLLKVAPKAEEVVKKVDDAAEIRKKLNRGY